MDSKRVAAYEAGIRQVEEDLDELVQAAPNPDEYISEAAWLADDQEYRRRYASLDRQLRGLRRLVGHNGTAATPPDVDDVDDGGHTRIPTGPVEEPAEIPF